jgi:hypothetical protein
LEKKNGREQHQIDEIRKEVELLKKKSKHGKMSVMSEKKNSA